MKTSSTQDSIILAAHGHLLTHIKRCPFPHILCRCCGEAPSISKGTSTGEAGFAFLLGSLQRRSGNHSFQDQIHHEYAVQFD